MKLIILLIALGLERFLHVGRYLYRFSWFENYMGLLRSWLGNSGVWRNYSGVAITVIPPLLILGLLCVLLYHPALRWIWYLVSLFVLIYCLGPADFYSSFQRYFFASDSGNEEAGIRHVSNFLAASVNPAEQHREITSSIFIFFNQSIFAVLFWFLVLGPFGALLYRLVAMTKEVASQPGSQEVTLALSAQNCLAILDWIPIRLLSLGFALVGNFMPTFSYWINNLYTGLLNSREFLTQSGLLALSLDLQSSNFADLQENKAAFDLIDRTLIVYLIILALIFLSLLI